MSKIKFEVHVKPLKVLVILSEADDEILSALLQFFEL